MSENTDEVKPEARHRDRVAAKSSSARLCEPPEHLARPKAKNFGFIVWFSIFHYDAKSCAKTGQFVAAEMVLKIRPGVHPACDSHAFLHDYEISKLS
jgi:hypothetical protein